MSVRLFLLGALAASMVALSVLAPSARAHNLGRDSVDCGFTAFACQLRWEDSTRYDTARRFAINQWNRLGKVDILPASPATVADVEFLDFKDCDAWWEAFWSPRVGADVIGFNPCMITRAGDHRPDPRAVAVHEVGHALRLAHPSGHRASGHWERNSIMYMWSFPLSRAV